MCPDFSETHHIGRMLEMIEAWPRALIEFSLTGPAPKASIPQLGPFSSFRRSCSLTVWTSHLPFPPRYALSTLRRYPRQVGAFLTEPLQASIPMTQAGSWAIAARNLLRLTRLCTTTWPCSSTPWSWNTVFAESMSNVVHFIVAPPSHFSHGLSILAQAEAVCGPFH